MATVDLKPIIIQPKTKKQKSLIETFLKALDLEWKDETLMSEKDYFEKIDKSVKQSKEGKVTRVKSTKELQSLLESL